ncbi:YIP1 family protein [Methanolobus psychrotolerans]|uniref:YIP1 family protein n=1 Tax=Methanolobus psychrotolerans TaxID=1874706 RepID=UPI000B91A45B|nr:Yip1 family protein [Methanolobus psychrotolerans]
MLEVLTDPNGFFKRKINEETEWKTPLIIMAVYAIIGALSAYVTMMKVMESLPEEAAAFAGVGAVFGIIGAIIGVVFAWALYSAVFYIISMIFHGKGDFKRVMEFVSYGFIPSIFGSIVSLYFTNKMLSGIDFNMDDPTMITEMILTDPSMKIAGILGIIFMLWSANIWVFGIMYSKNLSFKNAAMTVGIPIGIYVLYTLYTLRIFGV